MPSHILRRLSASTILLGLATPAFAQTSAADDGATSDTIVVTGSRIARPDLQQASPIAIVSAQELKLSGKVNVESIINDLPQLIPSTTAASNNPGGGVSTADLRGLGANRTLVLVDGRRYVSYDSNQIVDLNTVPAGLIDHVEVVSGGRSAVYGSDAIAGVINFVTKRDFSGVEANANYRINQAGDGGTFNTNLLMGGNFADGRGNATFYIDYTKRDAVQQSARSYTKQAYTDDGDGGLAAGGSGSIPGTRFALSGTQYKFNQDGSYSAEAIVRTANADLANSFGNLAQRSLSMIFKNLGGDISADHTPVQDDLDLIHDISDMASTRLPRAFEELAFSVGIEDWIRAVFACNQYVDTQAPWALRKTDPERMRAALMTLFQAVRTLAIAIRPVVPSAADALLDQMGIADDARDFAALADTEWFAKLAASGFAVGQPVPIFPRLELPEGEGEA